MPWTEDDNRVCGSLLKKNKSGTWIRRFLVLNFSERILKLYTEDVEYKEESDRKNPIEEYDLSMMTTVKNTPNPPKMLKYCFEFCLSSRDVHHFSAETEEDREAWVEAFRRVATNQGFSDKLQTRQRTSTTVDELVAKEVYRTTVIGGVVVKTSVVQEKPYTAVEAALKTDLANTMEKTKVLKAGFAVKQGAVRKNWKKRFFVLTQKSFSYYRSVEDCDALRTMETDIITGVSHSQDFKDKEFLLAVHTPGRKFYMQCESEEDLTRWKTAFESLPHLNPGAEEKPLTIGSQTRNGVENCDIDVDSFESDEGQDLQGVDL